MSPQTLFDRPLRRDPILVLWFGLLLLIAIASINVNTEWHGNLETERVNDALSSIVVWALLSFLVLALIPAWIRLLWRRPEWRWGHRVSSPAGYRREGVSDGPAVVPSAGRGRPAGSSWGQRQWPGAGPRLVAPRYGFAANAPAPQVTDPVGSGAPPVFVDLRVDNDLAAPGLPVLVSWKTKGADMVTIDGVNGFPTAGSAEVPLTRSRAITFWAHGPGGSTHAATGDIPFLPLPPLPRLVLPAGPDVKLNTTVQLGVEGQAPVMRRLDSILDGHRVAASVLREPPRPPQLVPRAVLALGGRKRARPEPADADPYTPFRVES